MRATRAKRVLPAYITENCVFFGTTRVTPRVAARSHEETLGRESVVEVSNVFAVAVVEQRRPALVNAEDTFARLAPAGMRHLRIDVGPEAVFARLQLLPETDRA